MSANKMLFNKKEVIRKGGLLFCAVLPFVFASCYSTQEVTSARMYESARNEVAASLENYGYKSSGKSHEEKNEITVTGQSYSKYSGYGTKMDNNYMQYDTYRFANDNGETAEYTVKYNEVTDDNGGTALQNVQVTGCSTSKAGDYSKVCNGSKSPSSVIGNMRKDATMTTVDAEQTTLAVCGVSVGLSLLVTLICLVAI